METIDVLQKYWGYDDFRPLQREIIDSVLDGHDTLGLLPTGGGKSITFQVPAMMLPGVTLVVTPLISLMKDQVDNLLQRRIRAYCLHSGLSRAEMRLATDRCRLGKAKILYLSPERLQNDNFILELVNWNVSLIVVDEAHCISQWGYDFRPSYLGISKVRKLFPNVPVLALTASATPEVVEDIKTQLAFRKDSRQFAKSFDRSNLNYIVRYDEMKERTLLKALKGTPGTAIVYCRSRRRCREIADMLAQEGISANFYHAGLDTQEKNERQNAWKDGFTRVMVATNAFGMGIDKADVRMVVHYDLPPSLEEYYQEAGRAGRDGLPAFALVIAAKSDKATLARRLSEAFPPRDFITRVYELAGDYLGVPVGSGYDQVYEFNFTAFCQVYHLSPLMAYSALKILSRAQYIEFSDEIESRSRVMIIAQKEELYSLRLNEVQDRIFSDLQRMYTGLFSDFTHIEETAIALRAEVKPEDVYQTMLMLSRMHILTYVPKKATPYLYFSTAREEAKHLVFPKTVYEDRKKQLGKRLAAMKSFVFDTETCRVKTLLEYFGEKNAHECGQCDVCRAAKAQKMTAAKERTFRERILYAVRSKGCGLETLIETLSAPREEIVEIIRDLADEGLIEISYFPEVTIKKKE